MTETRRAAIALAVSCERLAAAFLTLGGTAPAVSLTLSVTAVALRAGVFDLDVALALDDDHQGGLRWLFEQDPT